MTYSIQNLNAQLRIRAFQAQNEGSALPVSQNISQSPNGFHFAVCVGDVLPQPLIILGHDPLGSTQASRGQALRPKKAEWGRERPAANRIVVHLVSISSQWQEEACPSDLRFLPR